MEFTIQNLNYFLAMLLYKIIVFIKTNTSKLLDKMVQFTDIVKQNEIIYFDFETTGLNPYHEHIIDYAFLLEDPESNEVYIESLVNPNTKFDKIITDITGIHPDDLEDKKNIYHHVETIYDFINSNHKQILHKSIPQRFLVAHNCEGFDKIFLMRLFQEFKSNYPLTKNWHFIDTLPLAKKMLPDLKSHSLKTLCKYYNIKEGTHRALSDTVALKQVFNRLITDLSYRKKLSKQFILDNPQIVIDYYSFN